MVTGFKLFVMPGASCSVSGCGVQRRKVFSDVDIFQIPNGKGEFYERWQKNITSCLLKYWEIDQTFQKRLENGNVYSCELNFNLEPGKPLASSLCD